MGEVGDLEEDFLRIAERGSFTQKFSEEFRIVSDDVVNAHPDHGVHQRDFVNRPDVDLEPFAMGTLDEVAFVGAGADGEQIDFDLSDVSNASRTFAVSSIALPSTATAR